MKILLTGRTGQVGFELRRSLALLGEIIAPDSNECDLRDEVAIRRAVRLCQPQLIVNAAAYTAVDRAEAEPEPAFAINAHAPRVLAEEAEKLGAMLVHYSTDYVFNGLKEGAYTEDDQADPQCVYGATKHSGDRAVQAACSRHLILRTSWVVGSHGGNFAKTMLRLAGERDSLNVVADQTGSPTSAALLADITACLARMAAERPRSFPFGLYHAVAANATTWHEYACYVIERARSAGMRIRVAPGAVVPISSAQYTAPAKRPANSRLDTTRLRQAFGLHLPSWQQGLDHVLDQIF